MSKEHLRCWEKHENVMNWFDCHSATPVYITLRNRDCKETLPCGCLTCQKSQASRCNQPASVSRQCPEPSTKTGQSKHPMYLRLGSANSPAPWLGQVSVNFVNRRVCAKISLPQPIHCWSTSWYDIHRGTLSPVPFLTMTISNYMLTSTTLDLICLVKIIISKAD